MVLGWQLLRLMAECRVLLPTARRCCLLGVHEQLQGLLRTSLADLGHRMASSGRCCRASCSTELGTGTALFPRPFGLPGCDTTAATCAEKQGAVLFWVAVV